MTYPRLSLLIPLFAVVLGQDTFTTEDIATTDNDPSMSPNGCPPGWVNAVEGCFYLHFTEATTWMEAQLDCERLGGYLAEPKTAEQTLLLTSLAFLEEPIVGVHSWWIGLTDRGHEGRWVWQHSVSDADFTFWAPGSPGDSFLEEDCTTMNAEQEFFWSSENCLQALASPICQRGEVDINVPAPTTVLPGPDEYYVELRGGDGFSSGNVFAMNSDGYFGAVTDLYWDNTAARIVCRELGFSSGIATTGSTFGSPFYSYAFDYVRCSGSEQHLRDCDHDTYAYDGSPDEAAGVRCS